MPNPSTATCTILRTSSSRRLGSKGISSSSFGSAMTAAPYLLHEREDRLEPLVLRRHRIDERLALVSLEARLEHLDDRRVEAERQVGEALDEADGRRHELRLVEEGDAHVDVEHHRAAGDLVAHVGGDPREVAGPQLVLEERAPRRVDPLADDAERLVVADDHLSCGRSQCSLHGG